VLSALIWIVLCFLKRKQPKWKARVQINKIRMYSMSNLFVLLRPFHACIFHSLCRSIELLSSITIEYERFFSRRTIPFFRIERKKIPRNCITFTLSMSREFFFTVQNFLIARLTPMVEARGGHPIWANGFFSKAFPSSSYPPVSTLLPRFFCNVKIEST